MSVIMINQQPQMQTWAASDCDMCSMGAGTCCYVYWCMPCAAGDVATGAGKDFCMSCCLWPFLCGGVLPPCVPCTVACCWASDRAALAMRYNIVDNNAGCGACLKMTCGCACCLIIQELHEIKVQQARRMNSGPQVMVIPQQQQMAPMMMAPQMQMAPQYASQQQMMPQQQMAPQQQQYPAQGQAPMMQQQ